MPQKQEEYKLVTAKEIINMYFGGCTIGYLSKYVSSCEGLKQYEARGKVESAIVDWYKENGEGDK